MKSGHEVAGSRMPARWNPYSGYARNGPDTIATEGRPYGFYTPFGLGFSVPGWAQGALDAAGSVFGDPLLGQQVAVGGVVVGKLLPGGGSVATQARTARANVYVTGALAGIVDSARLLLGTSQEDKPHAELATYQLAVQSIQTQRPDVWQAATEAGPLHDVSYPGSSAGDGYKGLTLLYNEGIGVNFPGMGTDDGKIVSPTTTVLVGKLQALAAQPNASRTGTIPAGTIVKPGQTSNTLMKQAQSAVGGMSPVLIGAAVIVGLYLFTKRSR